MEWVDRLSQVAKKTTTMKLAAHLCERRVNDVLKGEDSFLNTLKSMGFQRVQINATARNGADTSILSTCVETFCELVNKQHDLEFILQKNEETRPLWEGLLQLSSDSSGGPGRLPDNVSMLVDESKGTGVLASSWPEAPEEYRIGYAGGIGPHNIENVLKDVVVASKDRPVWIDMESKIRSTKEGKDVFDLDKCYSVIAAVCTAGLHSHPDFLPTL